jgi:phosphatidylinositol alpha-1,6-mannosyltransferase
MKLVESATFAVTKMNIITANVCLAVCHSLMNVIQNIDDTKPCYLLTNGVDTDVLRKQLRKTSQTSNPNPAEDMMLVMGVIDEWLDLETPIRALKILSRDFPELKLVIIGPWRKEEQRKRINGIINEMGLTSNVKITGYVSDQELADFLSKATFCVMPYERDSFSTIIRLPEKLFMYSAYGKPILSTPLPEVAMLQCEHIFFYENVHEFVSAALLVLAQEDAIRKLSTSAINFAKKHDVKVLAERLEQILTQSASEIK